MHGLERNPNNRAATNHNSGNRNWIVRMGERGKEKGNKRGRADEKDGGGNGCKSEPIGGMHGEMIGE